MKKKIIIIAVVIVITLLAIITITNILKTEQIFGKLYRVDNVYDEIWNMVSSEKHGTKTILTTSIIGSEAIYEFGYFEKIYIPLNEEYSITLSLARNESYQEELNIFLHNDNNDRILYAYNHKSNTLYGNQEELYLIENFLSMYYSWIGNDVKFNSENPGDYTFVFTEYPFSHD